MFGGLHGHEGGLVAAQLALAGPGADGERLAADVAEFDGLARGGLGGAGSQGGRQRAWPTLGQGARLGEGLLHRQILGEVVAPRALEPAHQRQQAQNLGGLAAQLKPDIENVVAK